MRKYSWNVHKIVGAHLQYVILQSLNIKEWKLLELKITQTRHPKSDADGQTEGRMDGGSWPITRPALAKVTQEIISTGKRAIEHTKRLILKKENRWQQQMHDKLPSMQRVKENIWK